MYRRSMFRAALVCFAVAAALVAVAVKAEDLPVQGDPEPKFGGCLLRHPETCFSPTVSVNLLAIAIKDGSVTTEFNPGIGYGVTFWSKQWYRSGVSGQFALREVDGRERPQVALQGSFAEYLRLGVATPLWAGSFVDHAQLLVAIGSNFGFSL